MIVVLVIDILVVVTLIVASRRRLENALPALAFILVLMPFESRFVVPGFFDVSTERVALLTLIVLFLVRRKRASANAIPLKGLMALHIAWAVFSTCYSVSIAVSAKQVIAQVLEYYLLYYIIVRIISDERTVYNTLYALVAAVGVCCLFSLLEAYAWWSILTIFPSNLWTTYHGRLDPLYVEWGRGLRIRSTFPHPILFGNAVAMAITIVLYLWSVCKARVARFWLWTATLLMLWAVYKTASRGPWIAVAVSCVLLFMMVKGRVQKYLSITAVLAVIVLIARPGIWQTIATLYESTQNPTSIVGASYGYRDALVSAVREAVAKEPGRALLGYGLGTFRELGLDISFLTGLQRWYTCDNNWAAFLYETGYVGLLIIGVLLLKPLVMTLQTYLRLPRPERDLSGVFFITLFSFYLSLWSVAGYNWGQQGFMAWILISLSVVYPQIIKMRNRRYRQAREGLLDRSSRDRVELNQCRELSPAPCGPRGEEWWS